LGTAARSFPELVEQLGIMRFGHRPRVADTFSGSGQIPFEAARLGCDVYASDLNPIACLLTWGAFHIVGGNDDKRREQEASLEHLKANVMGVLQELGTETDGQGWSIKSVVYCMEAVCPQTGWAVPLIPSLIISQDYRAVAELIPDPVRKRYDIAIRRNANDAELASAKLGTVRSDGRGQDPYLIHQVNGVEYKTKISTLRGDYRLPDGTASSKLRQWTQLDFTPIPGDVYQERPYAIVWARPRPNRKGVEAELRPVSEDDLAREQIVINYLANNLASWQANGWIPDMKIESGYNTDQPIRERGWTYWHHLFNPRQLLVAGLIKRFSTASDQVALAQLLNYNSRLSIWHSARGQGFGSISQVFYNQALNTVFNYGCRGADAAFEKICGRVKAEPLPPVNLAVSCRAANELEVQNDIYVTDPPYGDAVKYEEILEFFISWLRRNPAPEFSDWIWDSRRALAIKGENEGFRRRVVRGH
jgi:putative DNA methylase